MDNNNDVLLQIKSSAKYKEIKRAKRKYILIKIKKWTIYISICIISLLFIFFPVQSGMIIGTWIHDFFGTIYKNIIK